MLRADINAATVAHMVAVGHGIKTQDGQSMTRNTFLQWFGEEEAEATPEELAAILGGKR